MASVSFHDTSHRFDCVLRKYSLIIPSQLSVHTATTKKIDAKWTETSSKIVEKASLTNSYSANLWAIQLNSSKRGYSRHFYCPKYNIDICCEPSLEEMCPPEEKKYFTHQSHQIEHYSSMKIFPCPLYH